MIADNAHYPTDTVAGFCAAVVVVFFSALVLDAIAARRGPDRSVRGQTSDTSI
jgi:undecaprenyl-diphosphatase